MLVIELWPRNLHPTLMAIKPQTYIQEINNLALNMFIDKLYRRRFSKCLGIWHYVTKNLSTKPIVFVFFLKQEKHITRERREQGFLEFIINKIQKCWIENKLKKAWKGLWCYIYPLLFYRYVVVVFSVWSLASGIGLGFLLLRLHIFLYFNFYC